MKRYIKPQIEVLSTTLSTAMLTGSREEEQIGTVMSKQNPFSFADEQSEQDVPLHADITTNSVWK